MLEKLDADLLAGVAEVHLLIAALWPDWCGSGVLLVMQKVLPFLEVGPSKQFSKPYSALSKSNIPSRAWRKHMPRLSSRTNCVVRDSVVGRCLLHVNTTCEVAGRVFLIGGYPGGQVRQTICRVAKHHIDHKPACYETDNDMATSNQFRRRTRCLINI
jgi:hypothetical protein